MMQDSLFPLSSSDPQGAPQPTGAAGASAGGTPRVKLPVRDQVAMVWSDLDSQISDDHPVRLVWEFARQADFSALYAQIRAIEGGPGRTAIDPRLLLALWLFATLEGYGSARLLAQLCEDHIAYRWLCSGVAVNYHTLADFRAQTGAVFDELLTDSVTTMCAAGRVWRRCPGWNSHRKQVAVRQRGRRQQVGT